MQQFDMAPGPVQKYEYFTACWITAQLCTYKATKPIKSLTHITTALVKKIVVR